MWEKEFAKLTDQELNQELIDYKHGRILASGNYYEELVEEKRKRGYL